MKASFYALLALIAISLSACTTLNPAQPKVAVYPAVEQGVVVGTSPAVPAVDEAVKPELIADASDVVEPAIVPEPTYLVEVSEADLTCMALAIYHEARGESDRGQAAVGWVIKNRVAHPSFPKTICKVVHEPTKKACQFSWYCDGLSDVPRDQNSYRKARDIAFRVIQNQIANPVGRSVFFDGYVHGSKRKPGQMQIGSHRFYESYASRTAPRRAKRRG